MGKGGENNAINASNSVKLSKLNNLETEELR
jgi:hypothetical protein